MRERLTSLGSGGTRYLGRDIVSVPENVTSPVRLRGRQRKPAPSAPGPPERRERHRARDGARDHARAHDRAHLDDLPDERERAAREHEQRRAEGVRARRGGREQRGRRAQRALPSTLGEPRRHAAGNVPPETTTPYERRDGHLVRNAAFVNGAGWTWEWSDHLDGTVRTRPGPGRPVTRTVCASVPVVIPPNQPAGTDGTLNWIYAGDSTRFH